MECLNYIAYEEIVLKQLLGWLNEMHSSSRQTKIIEAIQLQGGIMNVPGNVELRAPR